MPSLEETRRQVKAGLENLPHVVDHDAVLASLQAEIDRHTNDVRAESSFDRRDRKRRRQQDASDDTRIRGKFRFKSSVSDPNKRRTNDRRHTNHGSKSPLRDEASKSRPDDDDVHPLPRDSSKSDPAARTSADAAFRESLFDALADDEGAAYWEGIYDQPIHIYPRPTVKTAQGELEQMDDDSYAAYVQTKMWEKAHPHVVRERERTEKRRREQEEDATRRRAEYVRQKERAAWERAQRAGARASAFAGSEDESNAQYEYVFNSPTGIDRNSKSSQGLGTFQDYHQVWSDYYAAWDKLKEVVFGAASKTGPTPSSVTKLIPWPVLPSKPVVRSNIQAFFDNIPPQEGRTRLQLLKVERVRWHPDKIQQRFGNEIDVGMMKLVTGIFQVVDEMVESERKAR